jgi:DNA-binding transcriptional LysR family regulator
MDIRDANLLMGIAQRGSFAEVARDREVDPSWISRTVASIEEELGFRIFQRTTRRVVLTEAGDIYLRRARTIVDELDQARDEALSVTRGPVGALRVTAPVAFGQQIIVPLLPRFKADFPNVKIELVLSDTRLDLVTERLDLAIRLGPGVAGDLVVSKLQDTRYRVCASPEYLDRYGWPPTPAELSQRDCLRFSLPGFRSRWLFRGVSSEVEEVEVGGSIVVSGGLALHSLALVGMGPALLANWLIDDDLAKGRLVDLFPDKEVTATTFETAVWILYPSRSFLPRKVRAMIDFLKAEAAATWSQWR